jgi:hypothetical protein
MGLTDLAAEPTDFGETAAVIAYLNVIVTVDTAVAQLGEAMGFRPGC